MQSKNKTYYYANIFKGAANHWRLEILFLLEKSPDLSVNQISQALDASFLTIANHLQVLTRNGLIDKHYKGRSVLHTLTKTGKNIITLSKML